MTAHLGCFECAARLTLQPFHDREMSKVPTLAELSYDAAYWGHYKAAKAVLWASNGRWTMETHRARWDGAAALLKWWHGLEPSSRPPLDDLQVEDAEAFIYTLEKKGLARSTVKSYRAGASALTKALHAARGHQAGYSRYDPFSYAHPKPTARKAPPVKHVKLAALNDVCARAKLSALLTLLDLGLSVPEACTRYWGDVDCQRRKLTGYHRRPITISAEALEALETLWATLPKSCRSRNRRIFGWNADTARRWLKTIRT